MSQTVEVRLLSPGTVYRILLIGSGFSHVLGVAIVAVLMLLGMTPSGPGIDAAAWTASWIFLLVYLVAGALLVPLFAAVFWVSVWPGLWLYSRVRSMHVRYAPSP